MYKDEEARKCVRYLVDKQCELCKKFVDDCEKNEGIYLRFKKLMNLNKGYIKNATALIRTYPVCKKHFIVIKKDNDKRQSKGEEIIKTLELLSYRRSNI